MPLEIGRDGALTVGEPFADAANASFGARANGLTYLVNEQAEGAVTVLREANSGWQRVARFSTLGEDPCYLALDRHGSRLAVANYGSGSVALFALDADGLPGDKPALFQSRGSGPNADRQEGPHAHCVRFSQSGEELYLVDLGADRVECLKLGAGATFVDSATAWRAPPGIGPRHLLVDAHRALVLSELASTLTLLVLRGGMLHPRASTSTLPASFKGENLGGHLALSADGARVYVSNRGHDSIAIFSLERGTPELMQHVPSGGAHPRHFALLEKESQLVVAHEKDGCIALFAIAPDGILVEQGKGAQVPGACFVLA